MGRSFSQIARILRQATHDDMVRRVARFLQTSRRFTDVTAALDGWPHPRSLFEHIPDVTAHDRVTGADMIIEIETAGSIDDEHTAAQWGAFSRYAGFAECLGLLVGSRRRVKFFVVVPAGWTQKAWRRLVRLGVRNAYVVEA